MSSESSSDESSPNGSSSGGSSSESRTHSQSQMDQILTDSPQGRNDNLMPEHRAVDEQAHSLDPTIEETDADIEIVEESEEAETAGPAPSSTMGRPDLSPATYRIGRSRVTDDDLDEYVKRGLIKAWLRDLCRARGREEVPKLEPCEAVVFQKKN